MLLQKTLYRLLEEKLKKLNAFRPMNKTMIKKLKERFEIEMTYNSNAIEGNTLTLKETYWVIQQGITVKGKPLKDHLEAKNHHEALEYLYDLVEHGSTHTVSEHLIKSLHALVIQDINRDIAGQYRNIDVFITGTDHTPPKSIDVPRLMHEFILWARKHIQTMYVVDFAALFHHKFVHIHPFQDGNGRIGRLLMNIFLMQYGFPLAIIQELDRKKYYSVLANADYGKEASLVNFVGQAILRSLNIYLDTLTPSKEKEPWISLAEASRSSPFSSAYLGKLAKEGKIDAYKKGRNWVTTKEAIERYIKERQRKR